MNSVLKKEFQENTAGENKTLYTDKYQEKTEKKKGIGYKTKGFSQFLFFFWK